MPNQFDKCEIGDRVLFKNMQLCIGEILTQFNSNDGLIYYTYTLSPHKGWVQPAIFNAALKGTVIKGVVIDHKNSFSKLHLLVDKEQTVEDARWFAQTEYYTDEQGKCGMPKLNSMMHLYFPTDHEEYAQVFGSSDTDFINLLDNNIKPHEYEKIEKKMEYESECMSINCQTDELNNQILFNSNTQTNLLTMQLDKKGIVLKSPSDVNIAGQNILVGRSPGEKLEYHSKNILIGAENEIQLKCDDSSIIMSNPQDIIYCKAPDILTDFTPNAQPVNNQVSSYELKENNPVKLVQYRKRPNAHNLGYLAEQFVVSWYIDQIKSGLIAKGLPSVGDALLKTNTVIKLSFY